MTEINARKRQLTEKLTTHWSENLDGVDWRTANPEDYASAAVDLIAPKYDLPNISVDVIPLAVNERTNQLEVFVAERLYEPFLGEPALPGVLLTPHEQLEEAALRALASKTLIAAHTVRAVFDLGTFDNPDRDPRGATVAIAKLAIIDPNVEVDGQKVRRIPIHLIASDEVELPFDHNTIVRAAVTMFGEKFLSSKTFTKSVLGDVFTTKVVRGILTQMSNIDSDTDHSYDPSNLTRQLKSTGWVDTAVEETPNYGTVPAIRSASAVAVSRSSDYITQNDVSTTSYSTSRGRPSRTWSWK